MEILNKYIIKQVIAFVLMVILTLVGLDLFFNLVHELKIVGRGQYTLSLALGYLLLTIPSRLYSLFPWASLIGTLMGLGMLASHNELVVMRASGVSIGKIIRIVLKGAFILTLAVTLVGEGIAPLTEQLAQDKRTLALSNGQTVHTDLGLWVKHDHAFIHVQSIGSNGELLGITRYQFDTDSRLQEALFAESAIQEEDQWRLNHIQATRFFPNRTQVLKKETQLMNDLLEPEILETSLVKHPERLPLPLLWRTIQQRLKNGLQVQSYELALFTKLLHPVAILMMLFLAVPFVFGPLRSVSVGFRIVVGIIVAFLFSTLNNLFSPLAVAYHFPALLAVLLPILLFGGMGFWMLKRVK